MSSPPEIEHVYTSENCKTILEETIELLDLIIRSDDGNQRLKFLLNTHFVSQDFRSTLCFGQAGAEVSLDDFNSLCILPSTDWALRLIDHTSSRISASLSASPFSDEEKIEYVSANIKILFANILKNHPESEFIASNIPRTGSVGPAWTFAILGLKKGFHIGNFLVPSLPELRRRIALAVDGAILKKRAKPTLHFFTRDTGLLWKPADDSFDVNKIYLEVCSAFPLRLETLLKHTGKTLDQLARVDVVHRYPKVEALVRDALSRGKQHGIQACDMKLADGSLGGTVFAIHNAHYSVEWIASYLVDTDNNVFMEDVRATAFNKKKRLLRIFSKNHSAEHPSWIQFGGKSHPFIYLSRCASAAEQGFLRIQSYIINLLIGDINEKLKVLDTEGNYKLLPYTYDTGVVSLGDPTTSSLAAHQDGRPGIVCPHTPSFSRFMLMVPTLAFQNNCGPTATVTWFRSDDTKKVKQATFTHDFLINHFQLMQVNDKFEHEVGSVLSCVQQFITPYLY